jgi:hypothetical protein
MSWTKAPADESICTILTTSYEVKEYEHRLHNEQQEDTAIEVVWDSNTASTSSANNQHNNDRDNNEGGTAGGITQSNLIFSRSGNGQYVVDSNTLDHVHQQQKQEKDNQPNGGTMRRRSDSSTEITMVDDDSGGESSSTGNNSEGKEEGNKKKNFTTQYSPKRIWKKLVPIGLSSTIPSSSDIEATTNNSQHTAENNNTENLSTTSHSDGPQTTMTEYDESEVPIQQQINSTRLQRTISRVRARAAGYKQQLAIATSSSDDSGIVTTTNQTSKHTRKVVRGGRIIQIEAKLGADDFDDDDDDSSCTDDDYDIEDNEHDDDDDDDDQHHHHRHGVKFRRRRRYQTVETRSPSELIQRQEADERNNNIGFTTSTAEPTRID